MSDKVAEAREWLETPSTMPHYEDVERELIIAVQHIRALLDEIDRLRPLLADAIGLLQFKAHHDTGWTRDYGDVCRRYDAYMSGNTGQLDEYNRGYNDVEAAIEAARAEEREAMIRLVEAVADYWPDEKADAARRIGDAMKAIHEGMKEAGAIRSMEVDHASKSS